MSGNRTFTMIKPEAVAAGHAGKILDMIISNGFRVVALKYTRLSHHEAGAFYEVHKERPFYGELVVSSSVVGSPERRSRTCAIAGGA